MNIQKFHRSILILSLLLVILLAACTSETEDFIQGYWYRGNAHFMDQWYFEQGIVKHKTEVYHGSPIVTSGRYRVLEFSEDSLVLELYDIDLSFGDEIQQVTIKIDLESDTIRTRSQIYERTLP
ncbi:MAG: hypothetical protein MUO67_22210 [Anaerolineales bacterium]|nr:hypothetical protein [Anaerolineales bacterium]